MPDSRASSWLVALAATVAMTPGTAAHRLDEYLQAARLTLTPDRVQIDLDLTAGVSVAESVVASVDLDANGTLSPQEERAYVASVARALRLELDGRRLELAVTASRFPSLDAVRAGEGAIRLELQAPLPASSSGPHRLFYRNAHRRDIGVYLANAMVPETDRVSITGQARDTNQRELAVEYVLGADPTASQPWWLWAGIVGAAVVAGVAIMRRTRPGFKNGAPGLR